MNPVLERGTPLKPIPLTGPLDQYAAESLKTTVLPFLEAGSDISFDFSDVEYIHAAALQVLIAVQKDLKAAGNRTVTVVGAGTRVRELFRISGTEELFHFPESNS
jgi:anti-anti-sigma factor